MYKLSALQNFSSAHYLNDYNGDCARLHGHNWKVLVEVSAAKLDASGMAVDFKDLNEIAWKVIGKFDHQVINEIEPFKTINPTAENLARYFYEEIKNYLPDNVKMGKIGLWETEKYLVEYCEL
ncbi:MAG TPA: 6-carboxytetrahydropterin synthase QueD [Caldithrix sp.]|nr:6-carboxytetrahydropterin synthase QueD [Calditrichaceae bacterium]HEM48866.1 6-carboxytetrahydropterin synthase QueD [Caldithrix sp.]